MSLKLLQITSACARPWRAGSAGRAPARSALRSKPNAAWDTAQSLDTWCDTPASCNPAAQAQLGCGAALGLTQRTNDQQDVMFTVIILSWTCVSMAEGVFLLDLEASGAAQSLYNASTAANKEIADALANGPSAALYFLLLSAGLLTSLSPCTLSVLPLTIGYIGGYPSSKEGSNTTPLGVNALFFSLGLASTLALLGAGASMAGKAYGQVGAGLPLRIGVSGLATLMGLSLLEVVLIPLPSLDIDTRGLGLPPTVQAYLAGCTFALAASPCSTPVLATLLAFVSTMDNPLQGGSLLLAYTTGYVTPLLVAATFTDALSRILTARQYSAWIPQVSGALLVAGGTYGILSLAFDS